MTGNKINVLNKIFSKNTFRHWINEEYDNIYTSVVKRYATDPSSKNNAEIISEIYSELQKNYRNEYFYKNTLLNKLLIGIHSVNTTTALTEISIAKSKADFVMINGKAVVYEIKTELDNFDRLENQIGDYYKAFNNVSVVTCKNNIPLLLNKIELMNRPIGVYVLQKRGTLTSIREPEPYNEELDLEILFKILRKPEYEDILLHKFGKLPNVTQFKYYAECKKAFKSISTEEAYHQVLRQLKKRNRIVKEELNNVPYELRFLAYFMQLNREDFLKLDNFLKQQYKGV